MYREVVARAKELYGLDPSAPEVIEAWFQNKKKYSFKIYFFTYFCLIYLKIYILNNQRF